MSVMVILSFCFVLDLKAPAHLDCANVIGVLSVHIGRGTGHMLGWGQHTATLTGVLNHPLIAIVH